MLRLLVSQQILYRRINDNKTIMTSPITTSGVAESTKLLESLFQRILYKDVVGLPRQCEVGEDIKRHLCKMEQYFRNCGMVESETKATVLLNSISEDMQMELCGLLDFHSHQDEYEWIAKRLIDLYHPKESEISPYIKLFSHKQKAHQTTRDFLSEIRREGYRLLKELPPEEREQHMIQAFCAGLCNEDVRKALKHRRFKTLEETYNLIKRENNFEKREEYAVRRITEENRDAEPKMTELEKLQNQVSMMQKQLNHLIAIVQSDKGITQTRRTYAQVLTTPNKAKEMERRESAPMRASMPERNGSYRVWPREGRPSTRRHVMRCYNCNSERHLARDCPHPCSGCGRQNHTANRCYFRGNQGDRKNVRLIQEDSEDEWIDTRSESTTVSRPGNVDDAISDIGNITNEKSATVKMISMEKKPTKRSSGETKDKANTSHQRSRVRRYSDEIHAWANYIEGKTQKRPKTLISEIHTETAANKPIVWGTCQGHRSKILCDSGADVNVIDESFVKEILSVDKTVHLRKSSRMIKCANNSKMPVAGNIYLEVKFPSMSKFCSFL